MREVEPRLRLRAAASDELPVLADRVGVALRLVCVDEHAHRVESILVSRGHGADSVDVKRARTAVPAALVLGGFVERRPRLLGDKTPSRLQVAIVGGLVVGGEHLADAAQQRAEIEVRVVFANAAEANGPRGFEGR